MEEQKKTNSYFAKWHYLDAETGRTDHEGYVQFNDEQLKAIKLFVEKEHNMFLSAHPDQETDSELWNKWMLDAWEDARFVAECPNALGYFEEAYIDYLDLTCMI